MNNKNINKEIAMDILNDLPSEKKEQLKKALERNFILTSSYALSFGTITIYKEGWYLELNGTRCCFKVWATDHDGEFTIERKPHETKLNRLYSESLYFDEFEFDNF